MSMTLGTRRRWRSTLSASLAAVLPTVGAAQSRLPPAPPTIDVRIDGVAAHLTRVSNVRIGPDSTVLIGQPDDCTVAVFTAAGTFVRKIGHKGEALGDVNSLGAFGVTGDTVWITDGKSRRVTSFLISGKVLQSVGEAPSRMAAARALMTADPVAAKALVSFEMPTTFGSRGHGVVMPGVSDEALAWGGVARLPLLVVTRTGTPTGILAWLPRTHGVLAIRGKVGVSSFESLTDQPFDDDPEYGLSPDGNRVVIATSVVSGAAGVIRILHLGSAGDTIAIRTVAFTPTPLTKRAVDSAVHAIALERKELEHEAQWRAAVYAPPFYPVVTRARVGNDGTVWLRSFLVAGRYHWTIVNPAGQIVGVVELPETTNIVTVEGTGAWAIERNANGTEAVIHIRSPAAGRAGGRGTLTPDTTPSRPPPSERSEYP